MKRRQLARGRRLTRDGGLGVAKVLAPIPWLGRAQTEQVFRRLCDAEGRRFHQGGYETFDAVYRVLKRWQEVKGQGFEVTNENVSAALTRLDRPHSRRTVQYTRLRLQRAGVLECAHVKRSGPRRTPGALDTIRVHLRRVSLSKGCTPPLRGTPQRSFVASWGVCDPRREMNDGAFTASSPAASPPDGVAAAAADGNGCIETRGDSKGCTPPSRAAELRADIAAVERLLGMVSDPEGPFAAGKRRTLRGLRLDLAAELDGFEPGRLRGDRC